MPTPTEPPLDVLGLAADGAVVERQYPIAGFERLGDRLAERIGSADVRVALQMIDGIPSAILQLRAGVVLVCQRCLRPLHRVLESESRLAFVAREEDAVPGDYEPIAGDPRRVPLAALVEDELLLALPLIEQHAPGEDCGLPAGNSEPAPEPESGAPEMRRPFAGLRDLLKH